MLRCQAADVNYTLVILMYILLNVVNEIKESHANNVILTKCLSLDLVNKHSSLITIKLTHTHTYYTPAKITSNISLAVKIFAIPEKFFIPLCPQ